MVAVAAAALIRGRTGQDRTGKAVCAHVARHAGSQRQSMMLALLALLALLACLLACLRRREKRIEAVHGLDGTDDNASEPHVVEQAATLCEVES